MPLVALALLVGCIKDEETAAEKQIKADDELVMQYIENNNIEAERDATGFYYSPIISNPDGAQIKDKDIILFNYKISHLNGSLIEDKTDTVFKAMHNVAPGLYTQVFGRSLNPNGLDVGLAYMRSGEKFRFIIPSYLAYYNYTNNGKLGAYSNLLVDMEVVRVIPEQEQKQIENDSIDAYIAKNNLEGVQLSSGLHYVKTEEGTDNVATKGKTVRVHYTGRLLSGKEFDKSKAGAPISFTLGTGQVIKGWDEGIALMKKGEKGKLIIPSHLAYYQSIFTLPLSMNAATIPPFSVLVFDVELVDIL